MDANGTRFQLLQGQADWSTCLDNGSPGAWTDLQWNDATQTVSLAALLPTIAPPAGGMPLDPSKRRGAAADRFGHWYWLGADRASIQFLPRSERRVRTLWTPSMATPVKQGGAFQPTQAAWPAVTHLAGLAVTQHNYLVAGCVSPPGLLVIDLESGSEPALLLMPPGTAFTPFDIASASDGGCWVLDRANRRYWGFDRDFRPLAQVPGAVAPAPVFQPVDGTAPVPVAPPMPSGFAVAAGDPIAIEGLPDGSVLILDGTAEAAAATSAPMASTVQRYRAAQPIGPALALDGEVEVPDPISGALKPMQLNVAAHDIAYQADNQTLYAADRFGRQSMAFKVALETSAQPAWSLALQRDYLPMHLHGGRGLVAWRDNGAATVSYDVVGDAAAGDAAVRWARLQVLARADFARDGVLATPVFDGKERDCVWDAVFLDACIPPGASVSIASAVDNDASLLSDTIAFNNEPPLVLRSEGSEIPYYDAYAGATPQPGQRGTWEVLLQRARGRYLKLRIELSGNGRATPQVKALRAYYPRFSYSRNYLPAVYQQDPVSASFVERLLANPKGIYTDIAGKIGRVGMQFDPRSADIDNLDWLAGWLGLSFDPLWENVNQRLQAGTPATASTAVAVDRRRLFIRFATRLYARRGTADGIRFALHLLLDPGLESLLQRFRQAALVTDAALAKELAGLNLPPLLTSMSMADIENLFTSYLLSPLRPSKIRLVERFMTRGGRGLVEGDTSQEDNSGATAADDAHRFAVLVPETLPTDIKTMVSRIVQLEKPAHTDFEVRRYWDYFRAGEARLGIDTVLGEDSRFQPIVLGEDALTGGYLALPPLMQARDRWILGRDGVRVAAPRPAHTNRGNR